MTPAGRRNALIALVVLGTGLGGFVLGAARQTPLEWHRATAEVVGEPDRPLVNFEFEGHTWEITGNIAVWIDPRGGKHDDGWPTCLHPTEPGDGTQVGRRVPIRFAAVEIDAPGEGRLHKVVAVDCRPTS